MTTATEVRYIGTAETAKYIRVALKEAFPTMKFSVRSKSYSGGSSINIEWEDGPTETAVKDITYKFEGASFDGMIDLKSYHDSELNGEAVHFAADYVFTNRNTSVEFVTAVARAYCDRYNHPMPMIAVTGNNVGYIADRDYSSYHDYRNNIWRKIESTDASELDKMFEEEDRELAEYEARVAAHKTEEEAQVVEPVEETAVYVSPVDKWLAENADPNYTEESFYNNSEPEMQQTADDNWEVFYSEPEQEEETPILYCADCSYKIAQDEQHTISNETWQYCEPCGEKRVENSLHQIDSLELYTTTYKEFGIDISPVVGYSNWCDTVCCSCVKELEIDIQEWNTLTQAQSQEDEGFLCDYCTKMF